MKIIKQIAIFLKNKNSGYSVFFPEYPHLFTCGGPSKENTRYMAKDRLCSEISYNHYMKDFSLVTTKKISDYDIVEYLKENFSEYDDVDIEKSFIEELYFYYDVFTKRHWK